MLWTALATISTLILYFVLGMNVARARAKYGIAAPAIQGDPAFERVFRVQQNTVEALVLFLPALWLFAWYVSDLWAALFRWSSRPRTPAGPSEAMTRGSFTAVSTSAASK
jgi:hypothetical protein